MNLPKFTKRNASIVPSFSKIGFSFQRLVKTGNSFLITFQFYKRSTFADPCPYMLEVEFQRLIKTDNSLAKLFHFAK